MVCLDCYSSGYDAYEIQGMILLEVGHFRVASEYLLTLVRSDFGIEEERVRRKTIRTQTDDHRHCGEGHKNGRAR